MSDNSAAYMTGPDHPLEVRTAPYPTPKEQEIVIRSRAIALNPVDWYAQMMGPIFPNFEYPAIFGEDVAGDVVALGPNVTNFKIGDRVTCSSRAAFQKFPTALSHMAAKIPDNMSYEEASVIPLGLNTALISLFYKDYLALDLPSLNPKSKSETILIWGGSTSVGCNTIQCAVAAGYEVFTTASPHNFDLVKKLGASRVFDYKSETVQADLIAAFKGKVCAGAVAIGDITPEGRKQVIEACIAIVRQSEGRKYVALTMPVPEDMPSGDVRFDFANSYTLDKEKELGEIIFNDYLSKALLAGKFLPAPAPELVGHGLEALEGGLRRLKKGVSARKLVVSL